MSACEHIREALLDRVEAPLSAEREEAVAAHLADCEACRAFEASLAGPLDVHEIDLAGPASRAACEQVASEFSRYVEGDDAIDAELLAAHCETCPTCEAMVAVWPAIADELVALREIDPGAGFVEAVVARTSGATPGALDRARAVVGALLARPRIAWELAYLGAILVWLVAPGLDLRPSEKTLSRPTALYRSVGQELEPVAGVLQGVGGTTRTLVRRLTGEAETEERSHP